MQLLNIRNARDKTLIWYKMADDIEGMPTIIYCISYNQSVQTHGQKAYAAYDVTTDANKTKSGDALTALQVKFNEKSWYIIADDSTAVNAGTVTLLAAESLGTCNVYVMNNNGVWQRVKITVDTQPTKIALSKAKKRMKVGESQQLNVKLTPKQAETTLTWQTSDPTVATVDENGTVTATGEGRATITATAENGKTATVTIRVKGYAETANDLPEDEDTIPLEPEA